MSRQEINGFTLLELMVIIAILAILVTLALPSFQSTLRSNRVATTSNELLASLSLARSEGIRSTKGGGVCASVNGTTCCTSPDGATCGGGWNDGWLVWTESNGNGVFDGADTVARFSAGRPQLELTGTATAIAFDGRGRRMPGSSEDAIGIAPKGANQPARCIRIVVTGQVRMNKEACP